MSAPTDEAKNASYALTTIVVVLADALRSYSDHSLKREECHRGYLKFRTLKP